MYEPTPDRPSVGGDAHAVERSGTSTLGVHRPAIPRPHPCCSSVGGALPLPPPDVRTHLDRPFVGGDAHIAPPRPQARKTPPPSVREVSRLRRDGGRDGRGRTPPLRTSTERAPRSFPVIPRSEATWESVLFFMPPARGTFALGGLFSVSASLFAAAFALKCRSRNFYRG